MTNPFIHNVTQGSEDWEQIRKGKVTASEFHRIITPKKLTFATGAKKYAIEVAAEQLGIESIDFQPTYWMDRGNEMEDHAIAEFERTHGEVERVGFVTIGKFGKCGCSPDGFVGDDELIQVKCPKPETMMGYILDGGLPDEHRIQVQGELWITGRKRSHFYCWNPEIEPFHVVVERDEKVIEALDDHVPTVLGMVNRICETVKARPIPHGVTVPQRVQLDWSET